jgi:8-oxo-dGTP diphosphatase
MTVLCLIYDDDRILLQNRVKKDWQGYALPGGHVEPGESIVDAVIREMKEETGLSIHAPKLCGIKQFPIHGGRYLVFLFKTSEYSGELISSAEGKMEWIKRTELSNLETVADLPELLSVFDRDDLSEFQYVVTGEQWKVILH